MKCIFLIICLLSFFYLPVRGVPFESIDKNDKQVLECFFDYIIHGSSIGYSLCGKKPIASETFLKLSKIPPQYVPQIFFKCFGYSILWNGWSCWERYAHLFSSKKFVFRFVPQHNTLVLINKIECKKVIEENIDIFHKVLKINDSAEKILARYCFAEEDEYLFKHPVLTGILFGYGRNNSVAFSNASYFQKLEPVKISDEFSPVIRQGFFVINNGTNEKENKKVLNTFKEAKVNIINKFANKNNLATFLELYESNSLN